MIGKLLFLLLTGCVHEYSWGAGAIYLMEQPVLAECEDFQTLKVQTRFDDVTRVKSADYYVSLKCPGREKPLIGLIECTPTEDAMGKVWYYPEDLICRIKE